ncbi:Heterokaryon incompatibility protein 6, OR allele [Madurella mycetomatis]|uniref:Heterokaryon incompatibility protein 6, OR allele n=1 Tax=Madurella mycetomatis TaxID=100816 RepID=A0A175VUC1_9PEZI|nr:Heterokaryon incompatibility protein 6, OR allele [Madurella mycetomatis]
MAEAEKTPPNTKRGGYEQAWSYSPLALDPPEVRLLTLEKGSMEDPIKCEVNIYDFDQKLYGEYETLSYVWGGPEEAIKVGGNTEFKVKKNLAEALRHIRAEDKTRLLWVDAICINQGDKVEKGQQLGKIGDIYKRCKNCIIWLGTLSSQANPNDAVELLKILAKLAPKHSHDSKEGEGTHFLETGCFKTSSTERTIVSSEYETQFNALSELLALPWWKRTWTIQELALSPKIELRCGTAEIPYEAIRDFVKGLIHHAYSKCCKDIRLRLTGLGFDLFLTVEEKLDPMVFTREQRAEDNTFLQPSYTTPVRTAITEATFGCIKNEEGGAELLMGERIFRSQNRYTKLYVPSWVSDGCFRTFPPKWAMMERRRLNIYSSFASEFSAEIQTLQQNFVKNLTMSKNGILITESYIVGEIREIGAVFQDVDSWFGVPATIQQWMQMVGIKLSDWSSEPPQTDTTMDIFWRTLINNSREVDTKHLSYQRPTENGKAEYKNLWNLFQIVSGHPHPAGSSTNPDHSKSASPSLEDVAERIAKMLMPLLSSVGLNNVEKADIVTAVRELQTKSSQKSLTNGAAEIKDGDTGVLKMVSHDSVVSNNAETIYHLLTCLWRRRLFISNRGDMGLVPEDAETGDEIHVIPGCPSPFVLRPLKHDSSEGLLGDWDTDRRRQYAIIGNGFLHGFMGGRKPSKEAESNEGSKTVVRGPLEIAIH